MVITIMLLTITYLLIGIVVVTIDEHRPSVNKDQYDTNGRRGFIVCVWPILVLEWTFVWFFRGIGYVAKKFSTIISKLHIPRLS